MTATTTAAGEPVVLADLAAELGVLAPRLVGYLDAYGEQADRASITADGQVAAWAAAEARAHLTDAGDEAGRLNGPAEPARAPV